MGGKKSGYAGFFHFRFGEARLGGRDRSIFYGTHGAVKERIERARSGKVGGGEA